MPDGPPTLDQTPDPGSAPTPESTPESAAESAPDPAAESTLDPAGSARLRRQLDFWRRQLVALDRRQRQLYFKHTRTASLELVEPGPDDLAVLLAARPTRLYTLEPEPAPRKRPAAGAPDGVPDGAPAASDVPLAVDAPPAPPLEPTAPGAAMTAAQSAAADPTDPANPQFDMEVWVVEMF